MKFWITLSDEDWDLIQPYVDCDFENPMEYEFCFVDPSAMLQWRLATIGVPFSILDE
jgi:hypothetical protein